LWFEVIANKCKSYKDDKLNSLAYTLVKGVHSKSNIMQGDLEPGEPDDSEKSNVCSKSVVVGDPMVGSERSKIGHKKEIEEKFNQACLLSRMEVEIITTSVFEW
jgi:hypothetical protein